jgi:hypothetical protein
MKTELTVNKFGSLLLDTGITDEILVPGLKKPNKPEKLKYNIRPNRAFQTLHT